MKITTTLFSGSLIAMIFALSIGKSMGQDTCTVFFDDFNGSSSLDTISYPFGSDPHICAYPNQTSFSNNGNEGVFEGYCYDDGVFLIDPNLDSAHYVITLKWRSGTDPSTYTACDHTHLDTLGASCENPNRVLALGDSSIYEYPGQLMDYNTTVQLDHYGRVDSLGFYTTTAGSNSPYYTYVDSLVIEKVGCNPGSIEDRAFFSEPRVFPNPSNGKVNIRFFARGERVRIELMDVTGREIKTFDDQIGDVRKEVDLSGNGSGIYFIRFTNGRKVQTKKVVVQ